MVDNIKDIKDKFSGFTPYINGYQNMKRASAHILSALLRGQGGSHPLFQLYRSAQGGRKDRGHCPRHGVQDVSGNGSRQNAVYAGYRTEKIHEACHPHCDGFGIFQAGDHSLFPAVCGQDSGGILRREHRTFPPRGRCGNDTGGQGQIRH